MGQASCCSMRYGLGNPETRNKVAEKEKLHLIANYNFNEGRRGTCTIEESIMGEITNDIGELLSPQATQVYLAEFRKFIFLNAMNFEEMSRGSIKYSSPLYDKGSPDLALISITAPPMIDVVWRCFIKHEEVYEKFCKTVLGGYLDRSPPIESNASVLRDYERTRELLKKYEDIVKPFNLLWPELTNEQYNYEHKYIINVTKKRLETICKHARASNKPVMEMNVKNWQSLTQQIAKIMLKTTTVKPTEPRFKSE